MTWLIALAIALGETFPQGGVREGVPNSSLRVVRVKASPDTVHVGELFTLTVSLRLRAGAGLYAPDTLPGSSVLETRRSARWVSRSVPGDSVEVDLSWVLAAYRAGPIELPAVALAVETRAAAAEGQAAAGVAPAYGSVLPGGGQIRPMTSQRAERPGDAIVMVQAGGVIVASILTDSVATPSSISAPADVIGREWSPWRVLLIGVLGSAFLGLAGIQAAQVVARFRRRSTSDLPDSHFVFGESAQQRALRELDEILALGLHRQQKVEEFYVRSTLAVRAYVESFDGNWNRAFTTRELMRSLAGRFAGSGVPEIADVLWMAEVVKFGRLRPDELEAERDWRSMREWVHSFKRASEP